MKFRKKPIVIEAIQWDGSDKAFSSIQDINSLKRGLHTYGENNEKLGIETLEGEHEAQLGDWIIQGIKGEIYPCKPDIFQATYEPVLE